MADEHPREDPEAATPDATSRPADDAPAPVAIDPTSAQPEPPVSPPTPPAGHEDPAPSEPAPTDDRPLPDPVPSESGATEPPDAEVQDTVAAHDDAEEPAPRTRPSVPGADLEVDIVPEGVDPLARGGEADPYATEEDSPPRAEEPEDLAQPISTATIDLGAGARYRATGKRKTATARVILRPGTGAYQVNGRTLETHFPRITLQRNIRQPLETVGYEVRMDVVARLHGGGISAQAGALRHGISRALLEADPNLRGELKRRGFLTRDSRAKERKKAGLKKARKRPQFSKR